MPDTKVKVLENKRVEVFLYTSFLLSITTFYFLDPTLFAPKVLIIAVSWGILCAIAVSRPLRTHPVFYLGFAYALLLQLAKLNGIVLEAGTTADFVYPAALAYLIFLMYFIREAPDVVTRSIDLYLSIFTFINLPSIIFQVTLALGLNVPYQLIHLGGRQNFYRNYYNLAIFFDHQVMQFGDYEIARLAGVFEEPGMLGTYLGVLLCADIILFPDRKWRKIAMTVLGLLSLSLAFYVFVLGFAIYYGAKHKTRFAVTAALVVASLMTVAPADIKDAFARLIVSRLAITDEGFLEGDTGNIDYGGRYAVYLESASAVDLAIGHGARSNAMDEQAQFGAYQGIIFEGGFVGFALIMTFCSFFLVAIPALTRSWKILPFTGIALLSFYHRPDILSAQYLILYGALFLHYRQYASNVHLSKVEALERLNVLHPLEPDSSIS